MMPNVSTLISSAVSLSVLAGFVSGIFYLVVAGIRWAGEARLQTGEWLYRQVQQRLSNRAVTEPSDSNRSSENGHVMEDTDTAQVREFIEKLVENLVEGELDDVNVSCLYDHPEYKPLQHVESPSVVHAQLKQLVKRVVHESMALPRLKRAMERRIPNGQCSSQDIDSKTYEDILATAILNKVIEKYQRYAASSSKSGVDSNRNSLDGYSVSSPPSGRLKYNEHQARGVDNSDATSTREGSWSETSLTEPVSFMVEECIEQVTTYNSSEDDHEHAASTELDFYLSGLNFIQRHRVPFPELGMDIVDGEGTDNSDSDADDAADRTSSRATDLLSPVDSWEENWLFQKRRLKSGSNVNQPIPVPMLVPNPSKGFRALIGDRDAEEISDLSECSEDAMEEMLSDVGSVQSFTFLGRNSRIEEAPKGRTSKDKAAMNEIKVPDNGSRAVTPDGGYSGSAEEYASIQDGGSEVAEATNSQLFKSSSVDCLSEFGQQDSEYTEDYATVTRRQMSSLMLLDEPESEAKPVPRPRSVAAPAQSKPEENALRSDEEDGRPQIDLVLSTPPRPGTIAEREHKKWESAPPLANNPYSTENISKRLQKRAHHVSRSSSEASLDFPDVPGDSKPVVGGPLKVCIGAEPDSKKYGRDYYVNSSGEGRAKTERQPKQQAKVLRAATCSVDKSSRSGSEESTKEPDTSQLKQSHHVGSEVARWQKEINQTEQQWLWKIRNGKSEPLKRCVSTSALATASATDEKSKPSLPRVVDISKLFETSSKGSVNNDPLKSKPAVKCPKVQPRKQSNVLIISKNFNDGQVSVLEGSAARNGVQVSDDRKPGVMPQCRQAGKVMEPRVTITCYPKPPCVMMEVAVNGNSRHWDTDSVRSEESTISSIDSEYSPCLPSVKELAKQFSGSNESDSSTSLSHSLHRLSMTDLRSPPKDVVIIPRERQEKTPEKDADSRQLAVPSRPLRQVHSLTARSMSREFREGLRRNLPVPLDRNVHSFGGSEWNLSARRYHDYDTTPGYTSDESGTVSPVPAPGTLRNNIAFWESMKQSN